jgi:hypothetical protein
MKLFYRQTITRDLIEVDQRGRFRERLKTFEMVDRIMRRPDLYRPEAMFLDPTTAIAKRFITPALLEKAVAVTFLLTRTPLIRDGQWQVMATVIKADLSQCRIGLGRTADAPLIPLNVDRAKAAD